jgi:hypothetical protein
VDELSGTLPFTGFASGPLALVGLILSGIGFVSQKLARNAA